MRYLPLAVLLLSAAASNAAVSYPYQFGFEDNKQPIAYDPTFNGADWFVFEFDNPGNSAVVSGMGTMGVAPKEGNYYLEMGELDNGWFAGRSSSGVFRVPGSRTGVYTNNWYQAVSVFINPVIWSNAPPGDTSDFALGLTSAVTGTDGNYLTERLISFRVPAGNGGTVELQFNQSLAAVLTKSGWYNIAVDFYRDGNETTDPFKVNYWVTDGQNRLVASLMGTTVAGWGGGPFASSQLGDPRYGWFLGQNGFPSNQNGRVAIDDIRYGVGSYAPFVLAVPEPASLGLLGVAGLTMLRRRREA